MARSLTVDLRGARKRVSESLTGVPEWFGGILVGSQAALLSLLMVIAPALTIAASAPTADSSSAVDWAGAASIGTHFWLLAHGVPLVTQAATFSIPPLGLTLIAMAMLVAIARRFATRSWGSWAIAVGSYAGTVALVTAVMYATSADAASAVVTATVVAVIMAAPSVAWGIWRAHGAEFGWLMRVPMQVRTGLRLASGTVFLMLCAAAVAGAAFAFVGRGAIADSASSLGLDAVGGTLLAVTETLYIPVMVIWMLAWLTGQGFIVGENSLYSPHAIEAGALPHVPILGALPSASGGLLVWAPVVIVAVAVIARLAMRRKLDLRWADVTSSAIAVGVVAVSVAALSMVASGAMGPGRMADVGIAWLPVTLVTAGLVAGGFAAVAGIELLVTRVIAPRLKRGFGRADAAKPVAEPVTTEV
ncbi:cell division protein PerM [Demequina aurantiaca]|uniref:cell division protein PerM n=1 Tax=Demequina aurantiaca TaxID=676200 RepID=UPI003D329647